VEERKLSVLLFNVMKTLDQINFNAKQSRTWNCRQYEYNHVFYINTMSIEQMQYTTEKDALYT